MAMIPPIRLAIVIDDHTHVPVHVRWSLALTTISMIVAMAVAALPQSTPGYSVPTYWVVAAAMGAMFLQALVAHELAHVHVGMKHNIPPQDVTFSCYGGSVRFSQDSPTPRAEFLLSAAGPAANLALAALLATTAAIGDILGMASIGSAALVWMTILNVLLVVLNLLPGSSLDGGQMLMAFFWHVIKDRRRATAMTTLVSRITGTALVVAGFTVVLATRSYAGLWLLLPGLTLVGRTNPAAAASPGE